MSNFRFEGREIPIRPGQTIAAALAEAGERALRDTRSGTPRGVWCGMGVCQDCLVTIDGEENMRACMVKAAPGLNVTRQAFPGQTAARSIGAKPITAGDLPELTPEILVIGGGAGGLSAALAARVAGADVLLIDERSIAGGQYYKQTADGAGPPLDRQQREGAALVADVMASGVQVMAPADLWGAFATDLFFVTHNHQTFRIKPRQVIVATGAFERPWPVPGWTLPGVMTTGAMQTLWRSSRTLPAKRILVAGNGPLNLQVANELAAGGANIVAVSEAAAGPGLRTLGAGLALAFAGPALALEGAKLVLALKGRGIALHWASRVVAIEQGLTGLRATLRDQQGQDLIVEADAISLGYGFSPANEIARALGAEHRHDDDKGHLVCVRSAEMETTVPNVFAVGDGCGLGGAPAARSEGLIAGITAAGRLGRSVNVTALAAANADLKRHRKFQAALWRFFDAPDPGLSLCDANTLVCRCEEVTKAALDAAIADGSPSIAEVKRRTRIGMGRCQGRNCGPLLVAHLAETKGRPRDEHAYFAPRGPLKPVAIGDIVSAGKPR
jgi:thioredoxin reductase